MILLLAAVAGALGSSPLALLPGLHVYNTAGLIFLAASGMKDVVPPDVLAFFLLGMVSSYSVLNGVASIFLSTPDESTLFIVLPGQRYVRRARGYEAAILTGIGGLGGIALLALLAPIASPVLRVLLAILQPHFHWVLWAIIAFMLLSEWPKGSGREPSRLRRLRGGWNSLIAGMIAFLLSGLLGFILLYGGLLPLESAYQNLLPAFVGLFAMPWVLQNLLSRITLPEQHITEVIAGPPWLLVRGALAGALGGFLAAFLPIVTVGIGGFLAAHATAQRDDRLFLVSQGASKVVGYVGSFLLLFVPDVHLARGGMAWMVSSMWAPYAPQTYYLAVAAALLSVVTSFLLLPLAAAALARLVGGRDTRKINVITLTMLLATVAGVTGWGGLITCVIALGIGLIPVLWGSRRVNCMGVLLLPISLGMSGAADTFAAWLRLIETAPRSHRAGVRSLGRELVAREWWR